MKFNLYLLPLIILLAGLLFSCKKDEPDPPSQTDKRTLLIYAVATNSLSSALSGDMAEMRIGASSVTGLGKDINVLLYRLDYSVGPTLYELDPATSDFRVLKEYNRSQYSTDPERIAQVIADVRNLRPASAYGLVMWSHASGWMPDFSTHSSGTKRSFGQDKNNGYSDSADIDELAEAIPGDTFDFIWWDCCYMGGIEVAYQFRNKCRYMVAAPSEVPGDGMPYHVTLPLLAAEYPRLTEAAAEYYNYYHKLSESEPLREKTPATIAVYDMSTIDEVAESAANIYKVGDLPSEKILQDYARRPFGPFYDFGHFTRLYAPSSPEGDYAKARFDDAMRRFVVAGYCTPYNFNVWTSTSLTDPSWYTWDTDIYSGITCHYPDPSSVAEEEYYRTLDWWKYVVAPAIADRQ